MTILSVLTLGLFAFSKGFTLVTKVYKAQADTHPAGTLDCAFPGVDWEGTHGIGKSGADLENLAYAVVRDSGPASPKTRFDFECAQMYRLTSKSSSGPDGRAFITVAAHDETSSDIAISESLCADLCGSVCEEDVDLPDNCVIQANQEAVIPQFGVKNIYIPRSLLPPSGATSCGEDYWTEEKNIGGEGVYVDDPPAFVTLVGTSESGSGAGAKCGDLRSMIGVDSDVSSASRFVSVAAFEEDSSEDVAISLALCNVLCPVSGCTVEDGPYVGPINRCTILDLHYDSSTSTISTTTKPNSTESSTTTKPNSTESSTTTKPNSTETSSSTSQVTTSPGPSLVETTDLTDSVPTDRTSSQPTFPVDTTFSSVPTFPIEPEITTTGPTDLKVYFWNGACEEVSCGSVDWSKQGSCGTELHPCYAKLVGSLEMADSRDSVGDPVEVQCGHVVVVKVAGIPTYVHVVSIVETSSASSSLYVADSNFLGECGSICKVNLVCGTDCGNQGAYETCNCEEEMDAADPNCKICGVCSEEISGVVRGALENGISVSASGEIVAFEEVGAARQFFVATGLASLIFVM